MKKINHSIIWNDQRFNGVNKQELLQRMMQAIMYTNMTPDEFITQELNRIDERKGNNNDIPDNSPHRD